MYIADKTDKVYIPQTENTITASDYNQIKNEIQNAIELAGLTPQKDVIQLPDALQTLARQSGAEEAAKIAAEGAAQSQIVQEAGNEQIAAVHAAANEEIASVQNAAERQIALARDWAVKTDGAVDGTEYSAKKYAQQAAANASIINPKTYVKTAGDEMTGRLTVPQLYANEGFTFDPENPPQTTIYGRSIQFKDAEGKQLAYLDSSWRDTGQLETRLGIARLKTDGTYQYNDLAIHIGADGVARGRAPTPPSADDTHSIATTLWVRKYHSTGYANNTFYFYIGNIIVQGINWLTYGQTWTFPKAMANTNYVVLTGAQRGSQHNYFGQFFYNRTTTSVQMTGANADGGCMLVMGQPAALPA